MAISAGLVECGRSAIYSKRHTWNQYRGTGHGVRDVATGDFQVVSSVLPWCAAAS